MYYFLVYSFADIAIVKEHLRVRCGLPRLTCMHTLFADRWPAVESPRGGGLFRKIKIRSSVGEGAHRAYGVETCLVKGAKGRKIMYLFFVSSVTISVHSNMRSGRRLSWWLVPDENSGGHIGAQAYLCVRRGQPVKLNWHRRSSGLMVTGNRKVTAEGM